MRSDSQTVGQESRTFTERARRAQIVECAIGTVAELGYARASLTEIARRAGISKGVISYHFAGKDELIEQVVLDLYTRAGDMISSRVGQASTATAALRGYLEANLAFIKEHPTHVRVLTEIFMNHRTPEGRARFDPEDSENLVRHLRGILSWGQETGEFRDFATRPMAIVIRSAVDAASGQVAMDPDFDVDAYARELITLFDLATAQERS